jgi:hypothetical protein
MHELYFKKWLEEVGAGVNGLEAPKERPDLFASPTHHGWGSDEYPPTPQSKCPGPHCQLLKEKRPMKKKQRKS